MNKMAIGFHSAENGAYALEGNSANVIRQDYVTAIALDPQINETPQYASGKLLGKFKKDNGYTGNIGVTAQDPTLEESIGRTVALTTGVGTVGGAASKRLKGYYYEFKEETSDRKTQQVKVWLLNVEIGASSINHATDKESLEFGEYQYPITVYGVPLQNSEGSDYLDENGVGRQCFMITCRPSDPGYKDFEKTVPVPKVAASTATTQTN